MTRVISLTGLAFVTVALALTHGVAYALFVSGGALLMWGAIRWFDE